MEHNTEWKILEENSQYAINEFGDVKFIKTNYVKKSTKNEISVYSHDRKMSLNKKKLLLKYFNKGISDLNGEIWTDVQGYEGLYQVSNRQRVKSLARVTKNTVCEFTSSENLRKLTVNNQGYYVVSLRKNNIPKTLLLHRVIAAAFIPNPCNFATVNHIDGNKLNNALDNLEWCSMEYNTKHAFATGLSKGRPVGSKNKVTLLCS